jgi:hypothetical protein
MKQLCPSWRSRQDNIPYNNLVEEMCCCRGDTAQAPLQAVECFPNVSQNLISRIQTLEPWQLFDVKSEILLMASAFHRVASSLMKWCRICLFAGHRNCSLWGGRKIVQLNAFPVSRKFFYQLINGCQIQSYFATGGLPLICSSWWQVP